MFGELIGLWLADLWLRAGRPDGARYVELGPGRGTLAADALRAMRAAGLEPPVRSRRDQPGRFARAQAERLPRRALARRSRRRLPEDGPLLVVANEFFDALPVRQLVATGDGWRERLVAIERPLRPAPGPSPIAASRALRDAPPGTIVETSPASLPIVRELAGASPRRAARR